MFDSFPTAGFSSLIFDSTQSQLFASCTNDKIYMYNCSSLSKKPICTYSGHLNSTFYVKAALSPDDTYLLSGSSNNDAYVWKVNDPESMPFVLKGHVGEVTSVAWCSSDQGQVILSPTPHTHTPSPQPHPTMTPPYPLTHHIHPSTLIPPYLLTHTTSLHPH